MVAPGTLLTNPTVTITFDGLILLVYDADARLCQAGIHTQAEHHDLKIEVREASEPNKLVWPKAGEWDGSHANVKAISPLWLYVDSGNGRRPEEFSASLYRPDDTRFSQSFGHVLDFEGRTLYGRRLAFNPTAFSLLNIAQGEFYSSQNVKTELKRFGQNQTFEEAEVVQDLVVCSLAAADIDYHSEPAGPGDESPVERFIVLEQENPPKELFRIKLEAGKHYFVNLVNGPVMAGGHAGHTGHTGHPVPTVSHEEHFLQFYELFALLPEEKKFLVSLPSTGNSSPDAPPCNVGKGGSSTSFS